jgi:4-amino-4-deoxy-L-arabinose transferase-like glycosyltransferase
VTEPSPPPLPIARWELVSVAALACLLYLPGLASYGLYDPWETHYGEVARRMLEDEDYVVTRWQNETFRSKPVLGFWLMAASMKLHGVAEDGGWSGEFVASHRLEWSLRLPFALFGAAGIVFLWILLARLVSRRAAWLAAIVTATTPWYFLIARQAITDMPACGLLVGAMALFGLAMLDEDRASPRAHWIFVGVGSAAMVAQLTPMIAQLAGSRMLVAGRPIPTVPILVALVLAWVGFVASVVVSRPTLRQVLLWWMYLFLALSILAKGLAAVAIAGPAVVLYLVVTGEWRRLRELEIPRGAAIVLAVALPWHVAMYARDGMSWWGEYVTQHLIGRALTGVHGDRGAFDYFIAQMGPGLWPWGALLPAAMARFVLGGRPSSREDKVRALLAVWAIFGFLFFAVIKTKFHHYLLPAVPAFAALIGMWLDDLWGGRVRLATPAIVLALGLLLLTSLDLVSSQHSLVHLFVYRYDRPWPYGAPWNLTFARQLIVFAALFGLALAAGFVWSLRKLAVAATCVVATIFAFFVMNTFIPAAAAHWGQRRLHEIYFAKRRITGVDVRGGGPVGETLRVKSVIPETMRVGDPIRVRVAKTELAGRVSAVGPSEFDVAVPPGAPSAGNGRRRLRVVGDRLMAWQLNWRGENLYSNGEIWDHQDEDGRTVFVDTDNRKFLEYLKAPARAGKGRRFWLITEKGRVNGLKGILPTDKAKETFRVEDDSSNKFGLVSFTLD